MGSGKFIFLILWLPVTLLVGYLLFYGDRLEREDPTQEVIGHLVTSQGRVQLRPDTELVWRDIKKGQPLFELDNVVTGALSSAVLTIKGVQGQVFLAPDTQIKLIIPKNQKDDFELSLLAGQVAVSVDKDADGDKSHKESKAPGGSKIVIAAGNQRFQMANAKEKLTLQKNVSSDKVEIKEAQGHIVVREAVTRASPADGGKQSPAKEKKFTLQEVKSTEVNPFIAASVRELEKQRVAELKIAKAEKAAEEKKGFLERSLGALGKLVPASLPSDVAPVFRKEVGVAANPSRKAANAATGKLDDKKMDIEKVDLVKLGIEELAEVPQKPARADDTFLAETNLEKLKVKVAVTPVDDFFAATPALAPKPVIDHGEPSVIKKEKNDENMAEKSRKNSRIEAIKDRERKKKELAKKPPPPVAPPILADDVVPNLASAPLDGTIFLTDKPMIEAQSFPLHMELVLDHKDKLPKYWLPLVSGYNLNTTYANKPEVVITQGIAGQGDQKLTVNLRELMNGDYIKLEKSPFRIYHAAFVMGAKAGESEEKAKTFYKDRHEYLFQSIAEIEGSSPLSIFFSNPEAGGGISIKGWRPFINKPSADDFQLILYAGGDIRFVYALLAPAKQFAFRPEPHINSDGVWIYLARERKIIAQLNRSPSQNFLKKLKKALGADVIYRGNRNAYIGDLEVFKSLLEQKKIPNIFYVLHNDKFIEINLGFMKSHPSVGRFLDENATAFFREPIEVVTSTVVAH